MCVWQRTNTSPPQHPRQDHAFAPCIKMTFQIGMERREINADSHRSFLTQFAFREYETDPTFKKANVNWKIKPYLCSSVFPFINGKG